MASIGQFYFRHALTALTRVMPKDGRKHQYRLVGYYADHGKCLDDTVSALEQDSSFIQVRFLLYLHISVQRKSSHISSGHEIKGCKYLKNQKTTSKMLRINISRSVVAAAV